MIRLLEFDREIGGHSLMHTRRWYLFGRILLFSHDKLVEGVVNDYSL